MFVVLFIQLCLLFVTASAQTSSGVSMDQLDELCLLPANNYYCCKFRNPDIDFELRCEFLLKVVNSPALCQYL